MSDEPGTERDESATDDGERHAAVGVAEPGEPASEDGVTGGHAADETDAHDVDDTDDTADGTGTTDETGDDDLDDDLDDDADAETDEGRRRPSWALTITLGVVALLAVVALAVTALVIPGWAVKPGSPDEVAGRVTTALALKDAPELEAVSCRTAQGGSTNPFPPGSLQVVQTVRSAGPTRLQLDTQAVAPVDLVLSAAGQSQTLPADVVLAVTDGDWCLAGVSQRQ